MRAAIAVLTAFALTLAPASALAEEHADENPYEVTVSEDRAEIQMPQAVDERKGTTTVVFDTSQGLLHGGFAFSDADVSGEELDVRLHQLVEFEDENDDGALDDEDGAVSAWRLSNASRNASAESNGTLEWRSLETYNVTSEDGVDGTLIRGVAEFPSQDPIEGVLQELGQAENRTFTVNITVFEEPASLEGTEVGASQVHVEWTSENYPYTQEDTRLALVAGGTGSGELDLAERENATQFASHGVLEGYSVDLAATLSDQAHVDGNATDAHAALLEAEDAEDEKLVTLSYERGDRIQHQALLGASVSDTVESTIDAASDRVSAVPSVGVVAALGLLAVAALAAKPR